MKDYKELESTYCCEQSTIPLVWMYFQQHLTPMLGPRARKEGCLCLVGSAVPEYVILNSWDSGSRFISRHNTLSFAQTCPVWLLLPLWIILQWDFNTSKHLSWYQAWGTSYPADLHCWVSFRTRGKQEHKHCSIPLPLLAVCLMAAASLSSPINLCQQ